MYYGDLNSACYWLHIRILTVIKFSTKDNQIKQHAI